MAKAKVKTLLGTGLAALCSHIKQCNTALGDLSEATANGFDETDDILHEKQDVTAAVSFTIPVDGWGEDDSSPGYFYCDIPIAGLCGGLYCDRKPRRKAAAEGRQSSDRENFCTVSHYKHREIHGCTGRGNLNGIRFF